MAARTQIAYFNVYRVYASRAPTYKDSIYLKYRSEWHQYHMVAFRTYDYNGQKFSNINASRNRVRSKNMPQMVRGLS